MAQLAEYTSLPDEADGCSRVCMEHVGAMPVLYLLFHSLQKHHHSTDWLSCQIFCHTESLLTYTLLCQHFHICFWFHATKASPHLQLPNFASVNFQLFHFTNVNLNSFRKGPTDKSCSFLDSGVSEVPGRGSSLKARSLTTSHCTCSSQSGEQEEAYTCQWLH